MVFDISADQQRFAFQQSLKPYDIRQLLGFQTPLQPEDHGGKAQHMRGFFLEPARNGVKRELLGGSDRLIVQRVNV